MSPTILLLRQKFSFSFVYSQTTFYRHLLNMDTSKLWTFCFALVCYTAVFRVVTQHSSPLTAAENRTTFLSRDQPITIQLPFSGRCSLYVCGYCDSSNHSFAFIGALCVNDRIIRVVENKQFTTVVLSQSSPIQNVGGKQQQASRANCNAQHGCAHKVARYSFRKSLINNL